MTPARGGLAIRVVTGGAIGAFVPAIARLRIDIFREFPYLYDGDMDYEERYLRTYVDSEASVAVLALSGVEVVGVSTGIPLAHESEAFRRPFVAAGEDVSRIFYCGESLVRPAYRGGGTYREFFRLREVRARETGPALWSAFCSVVRADDDPRRPAGYRALDAVWRRFGYEPAPRFATTLAWRDVGAVLETEKPMTFWRKRLST